VTNASLRCGGRILRLDPVCVMGIINATPDSFSDGGRYLSVDQAVAEAFQMIDDGATIIDVGGESTRPGARPVPATQELDRVLPIIERLTTQRDIVVSIDTTKPEVMRAAVNAGATMINDTNALRADGALSVAAECDAAICLMHMQGTPLTMQREPHYVDVVREVTAFLDSRVTACRGAGVGLDRICIDPGFGFGKDVDHNLSLLRRLTEIEVYERPLAVGLSRKRMIGSLLGLGIDERAVASATLALLAAQRGASLVRVHDVRETVHMLRMWEAVGELRSLH